MSLCMWEVTEGSGPGGAGGAGEAGLARLGWAPEGRRGERVRRGPGSAAPPAAAGAAVAWLPCCCHGNNGGANLLMSPPQLRITILQWLIGPSRRLLRSPGWGPGTRWTRDPALHPSSPSTAPPWVSGLASPPGPSARLLSPPCSGHPSTPVRPCKDQRAGASLPDAEQQRPPPPPRLPPWEGTLPMVSPAHGLLAQVLSLWTGRRSHTPQWEALPR